jgi:hypothetical protein
MFARRPCRDDPGMAHVTTPRLTVRRAGERAMVNVTYYVVFDELEVALDQPYSEVCEVFGDGRLSQRASVIRSGGAQWLSRSFTRLLAGPAPSRDALRARVTLAPAG